MVKEKPSRLHLYPTMKCQLNCKYCYVDAVNKDNTCLTIKQYDSILNDAVELGVNTVDIAGGEPLLYQEIMELLLMIRDKNLDCLLVTNGLALDRYIEKLDQEKGLISQLHVSLDSANAERHDSIRMRKGTHQIVVRNLARYIDKNISSVIINYVFQIGSCEDILDLLNFSFSLGACGIDIQMIMNVGEKVKGNSFSVDIAKSLNILKMIIDWAAEMEHKNFQVVCVLPSYLYPLLKAEKINVKQLKNMQLVYRYGLGDNAAYRKMIVINHNGDVTGSTTFINNPEWFIGNVNNEPLKELWRKSSEMIKKLDGGNCSNLKAECRDCPSKRYCNGKDPVVFERLISGNICSFKQVLHKYLNK
ncbi:MAG: radical SAM protein [Lachnospiraceae bacterium]|nr:radical SAM protein [Lachnospiraceae bacterium]